LIESLKASLASRTKEVNNIPSDEKKVEVEKSPESPISPAEPKKSEVKTPATPVTPDPPTPKIIKSKALPLVPLYKKKLNTHVRMEQEKRLPSLSLRGGSGGLTSNSSYQITDMISPKIKGSKSLPTLDHCMEEDNSSQSLDTKNKQQNSYFMILWSFISSLCSQLIHGIKEIFILLWSIILLRFPFLNFKRNNSLNIKKGKNPPTSPTHKTPLRHSQIKKPIGKQTKFQNNTNKIRKTEIKDGKSRK